MLSSLQSQTYALVALLVLVQVDAKEHISEECDAIAEGADVSLLQTQTAVRSTQGVHKKMINKAQANASTGEPSKSPIPILYNMHIPKSGGSSWQTDSMIVLNQNGQLQYSWEGCLSFGARYEGVVGSTTMLRRPREITLSQYDFCVEDSGVLEDILPAKNPMPGDFLTWLQHWSELQANGWHGDFTPPSAFAGGNISTAVAHQRAEAWSNPPYSAFPTVPQDIYTEWDVMDGGGTLWHAANVDFNCYVPINFQTQRFTCDMPYNIPEVQQLDVAIANMRSMFFVGITERYQESLCLFHDRITGTLPEFCDCEDLAKWNSFPGSERNVNDHEVNVNEEPQASLIDGLTNLDVQLYAAAWSRFVDEVRDAESRHGVRILCDEDAIQIP